MTQVVEERLVQLLRSSRFNWFEFVSQIESSPETAIAECGSCESVLQKVYASRSSYDFTEREIDLIEQSYSAFKSDEEQYAYSRDNGEAGQW